MGASTVLTTSAQAHQLTVKCTGLTASEPDGEGGVDPLLTRLNQIVSGSAPTITLTQIGAEPRKTYAQIWQIRNETVARVIVKE